ncbi:MAG: hypothetical protein ABS76_19200 [Pelagibacterium sp. SCN 64-44]|nr:MAG: hypothetical protein ABS76_19200 [Pelagibacterium sp. SCN 64-44]
MATLALSLAGQFVGGLVGGPIGATVGRALGALAGSAVDGAIFGEKRTSASPASDLRLQGSSEGGAVPRLYGWSRISGNIIWARELEILSPESSGAKGFLEPSQPQEEVVGASFAVAFCEGEVAHLGRIWADGQLLDTAGLTLRFYRGTESQMPDGLIEATQGVAPAYRGLCYLVVEQLPLNRFGNRIPHLSVELCRVVGELEPEIRAITVIPGATEFGYDPGLRTRLVGPGTTESENSHLLSGRSDWSVALDELTALCPNLEHVALVVSWFGDDLRCGQCRIGPRVEAAERAVIDAEWQVAGLGRADVPVVSRHKGGAAYGGTPSDGAVLAAIADLRARGLKVTLYPLVMMDIAEGNGLPDPHGGAMQGAYPWRGRITCHPAPGHPGSPDKSAGAAAQVAAFLPGYRAMVLHYAGLAAAVGGVDAFIIGSEMVGMTAVRGVGNSFPFVSGLVALAGEVRAIVGGGTRLTYAADWSEYSGYQPEGEKFFHLDPLWASPNIDAVGIDNYMPLADWRDGHGHADAARSADGYDLDYLKANIAGGEGYDWYYASPADRLAQRRTPISDGDHDEPWIWRFKDIASWWSRPHHDRPGGVRNPAPTAWVPGSKPVWFTELGCGAVDKGANQPNIFGDAKSDESGRPYFSAGTPDSLIQRQALRAHQQFWRDPANNPPGMVAPDRLYLWTWDARPYPAFPARIDVWADGPNHRTGHWLSGRLGGMASDELARAIAADHGVSLSAEPAAPFVGGLVLDGTTTAREALQGLIEATGLGLRNGPEGLHLGAARRQAAMPLQEDELVAGEGAVLSRRRTNPAEMPGRLALSYFDRERDYLIGTATALTRAQGPLAGVSSTMTLDGPAARMAAERMLDARANREEVLDFTLPPARLALEPGDLVEIGGLAEGPFEITEIRDGLARRMSARTLPANIAVATEADRPAAAGAMPAIPARPEVVAAHLPPLPGDPGCSRLLVAGYAQPWPGGLQIAEEASGAYLGALARRGGIGFLATPLRPGSLGLWDRGNSVEVDLLWGHLAAMEPLAVLAGGNRIAVETDAGHWEMLGFAQAELVAPGRYRLSGLLRGQEGTGPAMGLAGVGRRVLLPDARSVALAVEPHWLGETRNLRIYAGSGDLVGTSLAVTADPGPALPLPPVHLRARRGENGDVAVSFIRCSRADGDGWGVAEAPLDFTPELYRLSIFEGAAEKRQVALSTPQWTYAAADQQADFGALPDAFGFSVAQISPVLGAGYAAKGEFHVQPV